MRPGAQGQEDALGGKGRRQGQDQELRAILPDRGPTEDGGPWPWWGQWGATEGSGERETVSFLEVNLVTAVCWVEWVRWRWGPLRRFFRG